MAALSLSLSLSQGHKVEMFFLVVRDDVTTNERRSSFILFCTEPFSRWRTRKLQTFNNNNNNSSGRNEKAWKLDRCFLLPSFFSTLVF